MLFSKLSLLKSIITKSVRNNKINISYPFYPRNKKKMSFYEAGGYTKQENRLQMKDIIEN